MKNFVFPVVSILFLASTCAWASSDKNADLRHCLDLQTNLEIATCAGELTPAMPGAPVARKTAAKPEAMKTELAQVEQPKKDAPKKETLQKDDGSFRTNVLIVKSHPEIESWVKLTPENRKADSGRLRVVTRGEKIYFPVIAAFSASQEGRKIALVAELELVTPDGKVNNIHLEGAQNCCTANQVDPRAPATIVLNPVLDIEFDANDLSGKYKIRAKINNGKQTVVAEESFTLM